MARSCLKETKLPPVLWGEAVRHAIYLLNRLPTRALTGVTPYEVCNEKKPHLGHIRIFGCVAHMKIPSQHVRKLDDRSREVINLGKEPGTKAYHLYDPINNKIWVSRDVTFEEDKSWLWEKKEGSVFTKPGTFIIDGDSAREAENTYDNAGDVGTGDDTADSQSENIDSPRSQSTTQSLNSEDYDDSGEPNKVRNLQNIYNETEEVQLDEELFLMGIEEPINFA